MNSAPLVKLRYRIEHYCIPQKQPFDLCNYIAVRYLSYLAKPTQPNHDDF